MAMVAVLEERGKIRRENRVQKLKQPECAGDFFARCGDAGLFCFKFQFLPCFYTIALLLYSFFAAAFAQPYSFAHGRACKQLMIILASGAVDGAGNPNGYGCAHPPARVEGFRLRLAKNTLRLIPRNSLWIWLIWT